MARPSLTDPVDLVQQHIEHLARVVGDMASSEFRASAQAQFRSAESPLEAIFALWWRVFNPPGQSDFALIRQRRVVVDDNVYRLDFAVEPVGSAIADHPAWQPIGVEMDGHAFHERTVAQVVSRDRRDRALQSAGWEVFHFSYSEFTVSPMECTLEVTEFAQTQRDRILCPELFLKAEA